MRSQYIIAVAAIALSQAQAIAQTHNHPKLHVNPRWEECSFQLDPSLTQAAWHQFTQEAGLVSYFRPLAAARPRNAIPQYGPDSMITLSKVKL